MKTFTFVILVLAFAFSFLKAEEINSPKTEINSLKETFTKKDILNIADAYINNNVDIKNPVIVDVNKDGIFDILNFTSKGNVEYYKNTGSLETPFFILEDKKFDDYEVNSYLPRVRLPVFFADKDGDKDVDVFGIIKDGYNSKTLEQQYKIVYVENTMFIDNYALITVVLILLIIVLLIVIVR
ncbi:MAG: hypothetical protein M3R36_11345 [Bacteroidota bacterium]|nr:hypothetical protein [Bacteroidota bacterium]